MLLECGPGTTHSARAVFGRYRQRQFLETQTGKSDNSNAQRLHHSDRRKIGTDQEF